MTREEIEARGYRVERVGQAWRITRPGTSILVADLRLIGQRDLLPTAPSTPVHLHENQHT